MMDSAPPSPCWAVIFSPQSMSFDPACCDIVERMLRLARVQPGFLGVEKLTDDHGLTFQVSYWDNVDAIASWRHRAEDMVERRMGRNAWYHAFAFRVNPVPCVFGYRQESTA